MMKRVLVGTSARISFLCMMTALMAAPALYGQAAGGSSDEWKFKLAPYLVFPWMDGNAAVRGREVDVNVGAGDILSNLQFGAMGYFEARKGAWGFGAASKFAWQVFPTVGINVGKKARIGFGYRALGMNYETGSGDTLFRYDVITSGPVLGMAFNF
jgi:hypothetical protein